MGTIKLPYLDSLGFLIFSGHIFVLGKGIPRCMETARMYLRYLVHRSLSLRMIRKESRDPPIYIYRAMGHCGGHAD